MATTKRTIYSCDNPSCSTERLGADADVEATGFHGQTRKIHRLGGTGNVSWYACKEACIRAAVTTAVTRREV